MTSRRTRIKAMANIPQRRKTAISSNIDENLDNNLKVEVEKDGGNPNLTFNSNDQNEPEQMEENQSKINIKLEDITYFQDPDSQPVIETKKVEAIETQPEDSNSAKPGILGRRKLIKPPVSLKTALSNRKNRDGDDSHIDQMKVDEKPPLPKKKGDKIIILDEIITHSKNPIVLLPQMNLSTIKINPKAINREEDSLMSPPPPLLHHSFPINDSRKPPPGTFIPVQHLDGDYPVPPPSPSKLNRSRIRYTPRLGQRHASFSASESEDESRKHPRQRNDSVCSTMSGTMDSTSVSECLSPQKPLEFNSVIQRKCRRSEQSRKLAEARREFYQKFGNKQPDRRKLTMIDLIFYNPTTNPMNHETTTIKKDVDKIEDGNDQIEDDPQVDHPPPSPPDNVNHDEEESLAPQIKIGPGGEIVLDEQSLVVENKAVKKSREEIQKSKIIDGNFETGYGVYKKAKRSKDWNKHETLKFYKALNTIGTDFALMCEFFPRRDRRELKMKFKKEERINRTLIDKALMQPCRFDFNELKLEVDLEEKQLAELEKQKEREKDALTRKRKNSSVFSILNKDETVPKPAKILKKRKKKLTILDALSDSDADISDCNDNDDVQSASDVNDDNDDDDDDVILKNVQKPTRSGRVPKLLDRYNVKRELDEDDDKNEAAPPLNEKNPGDLMVVPTTGPTGDLVYKVFMVTTGDKNCHDNTAKKTVDSIFTLTTSISKMTANHNNNPQGNDVGSSQSLGDDPAPIVEERNFTICEDRN